MSDDLLNAQYGVRESLLAALRADLEGPHSTVEVIEDAPITSYIVGVLYPQSGGALAEELDHDPSDEGDDGLAEDPGVSLAHVRYPSSVGLSFAVEGNFHGQLTVRVTCARYEQLETELQSAEAAPSRSRRRDADSRPWMRVPIEKDLQVEVGAPDSGSRVAVVDGLELFVRSRQAAGAWAITLALVNTHRMPAASGQKDADSFFQSHIRVTAARGGPAPFVERPDTAGATDDADVRSNALLYRHSRTYAIGHGCGAAWDTAHEHPEFLETTYTPTYELRLSESNPSVRLRCLDVAFLASAEQQEAVAALRELPTAYAAWIEEQRGVAIESNSYADGVRSP